MLRKLGYKKTVSIVLVSIFVLTMLTSFSLFFGENVVHATGVIVLDKINSKDTCNTKSYVIGLNTTANNALIILDIGSYGKTITSVTDNKGITVTLKNSTSSGSYNVYRYYAVWSSHGAIGFDVTSSSSYEYFGMILYDILNANTTSPFDGSTIKTSGTSSNPVYAQKATTNANDMLIADVEGRPGGLTNLAAVSPFTSIVHMDSYDTMTSEYRIVSSTGTYQANFTSANSNWVEMLDAVKSTITTTAAYVYSLDTSIYYFQLQNGAAIRFSPSTIYFDNFTYLNSDSIRFWHLSTLQAFSPNIGWETSDNLTIISLNNNIAGFNVTGLNGNSYLVKVWCGNQGKPTRVYLNNVLLSGNYSFDQLRLLQLLRKLQLRLLQLLRKLQLRLLQLLRKLQLRLLQLRLLQLQHRLQLLLLLFQVL
ncbi:MAG: hypothetical protein ABSB40_02090 [Nitrososphaeria archaeon]